tara:strand:- start:129 stop:251 length:123 start_codon:yes stop_codon:yes gene_type:complete
MLLLRTTIQWPTTENNGKTREARALIKEIAVIRKVRLFNV